MNQPPGSEFDRLDPDLARRVDAAGRRFEGDWPAGKGPSIGDDLGGVAAAGRAAMRAEFEAL